MTTIRTKRIKWLIIHEHYCTKKRIREKYLKKRKRLKDHKNRKYEILDAPEFMSLKSNFNDVVIFFNKLRDKTTGSQKVNRMLVNFETISVLKSGAALILAAELYRWQALNLIKLKPYKPERWDSNVKRLFNELGLFDLLKTSKKFRNTKPDAVGSQTFFTFLTGKTTDGALANTLMEKMSPIINSHYNERLLYVALSEAMTNVLNHAYPDYSDVFNSDLKNRWWLSGSFDRDTKIMSVLLYDQGVGIPKTLPSKPVLYKNILRFLNEKRYAITDQGRLIQAAVKVGRSRTEEGHRGKGLKQILKFSSDSKFGRLYIVSRKGEYFFDEDCIEKTNNCSVELGGTFIQWEIKLEKDLRDEDIRIKDCRGIH